MPDLNQHLTSQQLAAVDHSGGPMLVVAGAGSGKTRVLVYRLARLVADGEPPANILLMTFTNRAAREMMQRAEEMLSGDIRGMTGGTFHHVGNLLVRRYAGRLGLDPGFTIIDREDAKHLMKSCREEAAAEFGKKYFPNAAELVRISGFSQNTLQSLSAALKRLFPVSAAVEEGVRQALELYQQRKAELKVADFDDLLTYFYRLLRDHADVRASLGAQFRHILVDEYQDTNRIQGEIVDALAAAHRNLCVVGDDAQSIYSFRGADFNNIMQFTERYPDAAVYRLEDNFRSASSILDIANINISCNQRRLPKLLRSARTAGTSPLLIRCYDGNQQAELAAEHIQHLLAAKVPAEEIAVLYRSHYHSMEIQMQLRRWDIPFQVRGGLRFFEQAHVKDLLAFLRVLENPRDQTAWMRLLPMLPGVGRRTAEKAARLMAAERQQLPKRLEELQPKIPAKGREEFSIMSGALKKGLALWPSPEAVLETALNSCYNDYMFSNFQSPERRSEDLQGVINYAGQYSMAADFLGDVTLSSEYSGDPGQEMTGQANAPGQVVLSTVHQAKGLEWQAVLIPWLTEGRFPASQSLDSDEALEEERRIFHVALTRARDWLALYQPRAQYMRKKGLIKLEASRFVQELPADMLYAIDAERMTPPFGALLAGSDPSALEKHADNETAQPAEPWDNEFFEDEPPTAWLDDDMPVVWRD